MKRNKKTRAVFILVYLMLLDPSWGQESLVVAPSDQLGTLIDECKFARQEILAGKDVQNFQHMESLRCVDFIEGISIPMQMVCNYRKNIVARSDSIPAAMAMDNQADITTKIDAIVDYFSKNSNLAKLHRGPVVVRAFSAGIPCR